MSDTPETSIHASFQEWRARLDATTAAGTVPQAEMLALMFDLRQTLEDVAYRLHASHQADYLAILGEYSAKHDLVLELPPRKPTS